MRFLRQRSANVSHLKVVKDHIKTKGLIGDINIQISITSNETPFNFVRFYIADITYLSDTQVIFVIGNQNMELVIEQYIVRIGFIVTIGNVVDTSPIR